MLRRVSSALFEAPPGARIQIVAESQGNNGVGFAVPVDTVKNVTAQIIRVGKVDHAFLGVEAARLTDDIARLFNLSTRQGLLIGSVVPGSAAEKAGLRKGNRTVIVGGESWRVGGDIITAIDGTAVTSPEQMRAILAKKRPGDKIVVEVYRGETLMKVTVKLGRAPSAQ